MLVATDDQTSFLGIHNVSLCLCISTFVTPRSHTAYSVTSLGTLPFRSFSAPLKGILYTFP